MIRMAEEKWSIDRSQSHDVMTASNSAVESHDPLLIPTCVLFTCSCRYNYLPCTYAL